MSWQMRAGGLVHRIAPAFPVGRQIPVERQVLWQRCASARVEGGEKNMELSKPSNGDENRSPWALVGDAHCHPQLDKDWKDLLSLSGRPIALMAVSFNDWSAVDSASELLPNSVRCFGIHPWWSQLHASDDVAPDKAGMFEAKKRQHMEAATEVLNSIPSPVPQSVWEGELRRRLREDERAAVGEIGLDRAAVIPGTRVQVRIEHQMALVKAQVALAAEFARPVSVHCVRAHGHLEEFLRGLPMDGAPPRVMLHSYNGSVEMARRFLALPNGLGSRVFFSFNTVVKNKREAVIERIRAVPDDRVLAESDATDVSHVEEWLGSSCDIIAEAKGWSREEAARRLRENFRTFYGLHEAP